MKKQTMIIGALVASLLALTSCRNSVTTKYDRKHDAKPAPAVNDSPQKKQTPADANSSTDSSGSQTQTNSQKNGDSGY